jgi:uncharacterized protein
MSGLKSRIQDDVKSAMRNRDTERLTTLRMITAAIKQIEVDKRIELDDTAVLSVLTKLSKQHRESIKQFENAGRTDLVEKENKELNIVLSYLPQQLSEDEVTLLIQSAITETGAESAKDMGKIMSHLKLKVQGRFDMGKISSMVKAQLNH